MDLSKNLYVWFGILFLSFQSCSETEPTPPCNSDKPGMEDIELVEGVDYFLPHIDLSNWKVTLPIGNPTEVKPPDILEYATSDLLKDFMYNDSMAGSLDFYTYPGSTTTNASNSRTELREQMVPGSNNTNWTFAEGGKMKGTLSLEDISIDSQGKPHRTIVMQIHGRLTNEQRDLIGKSDNNAPPVLKIYWNNHKVRVHRKILKDLDVNDIDILKEDAWTDEAVWLGEEVNNDKFDLEVLASEGKLKVVLNETDSIVWEDIHMQKWGVFENYFKAGNYFQSRDEGSSATVKYYALEVTH